MYHMTLREYLNSYQIKIPFGPFDLIEGDIIHLTYFYIHSKSLLITNLIQSSLPHFDSILFFDSTFSLNYSEIQSPKLLKYNIFNAWEFLFYLRSLHSFLKDSKLRVFIVIDSWNTYFWSENSKEKILISMLESKCWQTVFELKEKFLATFIICRKVFKSQQGAIVTSAGSFMMIEMAKKDGIRGFGVLDPRFLDGTQDLVHVVVDEDYKKAGVFVFPFRWKSIESITITQE